MPAVNRASAVHQFSHLCHFILLEKKIKCEYCFVKRLITISAHLKDLSFTTSISLYAEYVLVGSPVVTHEKQKQWLVKIADVSNLGNTMIDNQSVSST